MLPSDMLSYLWMVRTLLRACRVRRALENTCKPVGDGPDAALTYGRGLLQVLCLTDAFKESCCIALKPPVLVLLIVSIGLPSNHLAMSCRWIRQSAI